MTEQTITVASPEPALLERASQMLAISQSYEIECIEMREAAAEDLQRCKGIAKELNEKRFAITRPLDEAKARVMELFRAPLAYLEQAENALKRACLGWDLEQERKRREAEAEANRMADEERKRMADAAAAEKAKGNIETAHAIQQAALFVAPVSVAPAQKIVGESQREVWSAEMVDMVALARAVGDGKASSELLLPNLPALNAQARSLKATLSIPGVRAVCKRVLASRAS